IVVSPRLQGGDTTLASFADFINWPGHTFSFQLVFESPGGEKITLDATQQSDDPDSALWGRLFSSSTAVYDRAAAPNFKNNNVRSYPVGAVATFLENFYTDAIIDDPAHPPAVNSNVL